MKRAVKRIQLKVDLNVLVTLLLVLFLAVSGTISASATPANQNSAQTDSPDPNSGVQDTENPEGELQTEGPLPEVGDANGEENPQIGPGAQLEGAAELSAVSGSGGKSFYITNFSVYGNGALPACSTGYHMASLWELHDVTQLTYASGNANAKLRGDNGTGPTAGWWGWVRTGYDSSVASTAGLANCNNWASNTGGEFGTIVQLTSNWSAASIKVSPWEASSWTCGGTAPVWCIGD